MSGSSMFLSWSSMTKTLYEYVILFCHSGGESAARRAPQNMHAHQRMENPRLCDTGCKTLGDRMVMTMTGARKGNGKGRLEATENEEECGMLNRGVPF